MMWCLLRIVYEQSMISDIERACLSEIGHKSGWCAEYNHLCEKLSLRRLVDLLRLRNISKNGMAMFGMENDRDVGNNINVEIIKEYGRRWWMNGFE